MEAQRHLVEHGSVAAALEDIQSRQQLLAKGNVARRVEPTVDLSHIVGEDDEKKAGRTTSPGRRYPSPTHGRPIPQPQLVWITKSVQRWKSDGSLVEQMGTLEFLRGATLADIRILVSQFYPLPHKREYEFYHPMLRIPISPSDEVNIDPADFEALALVTIPKPVSRLPHPVESVPNPQVRTSTSTFTDGSHRNRPDRETTVKIYEPPKSTAPAARRQIVKPTTATVAPTLPAVEGVNADMPTSHGKIVLKSRPLCDGTVCDVVVRELRDGTVVFQGRVLEGAYAGWTISPKSLTRVEVQEAAQDHAIAHDIFGHGGEYRRYNVLVDKLSIKGPSALGNNEIELVFSSTKKTGGSHIDRSKPPMSSIVDISSAKRNDGPEIVQPARVQNRQQSMRGFAASREKRDLGRPPTSESGHVQLKTESAQDHRAAQPRSHQSPTAHLTVTTSLKPQEENRHQVDTPSHESSDGRMRLHHAQKPVDSMTADQDGVQQKPRSLVRSPTGRQQAIIQDGRRAESSSALASNREHVRPEDSGHKDRTLLRHDTQNKRGYIRSVPAELKAGLGKLDDGATTKHITNPSHTSDDAFGPDTTLPPCDTTCDDVSTTDHAVPDDLDRLNDQFPAQVDPVATVLSSPTELPSPTDSSAVAVLVKEMSGGITHGIKSSVSPSSQYFVNTVMDFLLDLYKVAVGAEKPLSTSLPLANTPALFSVSQFHSAFQSYGLDHTVLALNGVLLAIEDALSTWSGDQWEQAQNPFDSYLLVALSRLSAPSSSPDALLDLQLFEAAVNIVANLFAWGKPTAIRLEVVERLNDSSFENLSGIKGKKSIFQVSNNERSLLGRILGGLWGDSSSELEKWLADALEVMYFFLHAFLTADKDKSQGILTSRELRLQWVIHKIIGLEAGMWKRIEFYAYTIDNYMTWHTIRDRLDAFHKKRHHQSKLLDSDIFLRAMTTFIEAKSAQIYHSLSQAVSRLPPESSDVMVQRFVVLVRHDLQTRSADTGTQSAFLRDFGLQLSELDTINKERQARFLSRLNVSGNQSIHTHHQTGLLASNYGLHKRSRWDQPDMVVSPASNWYVFHGDESIALEYVYVRHSLDLRSIGSRWEDEIKFAENEASTAFRHFRGVSSSTSSKKSTILCAVGVNALQAGWLSDSLDLESPRTVAIEHPLARSLSVGYYLSQNEDFPSIRITFRIHTDVATSISTHREHFVPTANIMHSLDRFICSASDDALHMFVRVGGLRFLAQSLEENRDRLWKAIPYGGEFSSHFLSSGVSVVYPREDVLFFIRSLLPLICRSDDTVTSANVSLLGDLAVFQGSEGEDHVVQAATRTFVNLCRPTPLESDAVQGTDGFSTIPLQTTQKKFLSVDGLLRLKGAIDGSPVASRCRELLVDSLFALLVTPPFCSQEGFFVHGREWITYFVSAQAWNRSLHHAALVRIVLERIHASFFVFQFAERDRVYCGCGCRGSAPATHSAFVDVVRLYCALLKTDLGTQWALQQLDGPLDLLLFVEWTRHEFQPSSAKSTTIPASELISTTLTTIFGHPILPHDVLGSACTVIIPKLLAVVGLIPATDMDLKIGLLQVLGTLLGRSIQVSLWKTSGAEFLQSLLTFVSAVVDGPLETRISTIMLEKLLRHNETIEPDDDSLSGSLLSLLYQEHVKTATLTDRCGVSILQSMMKLLRVSQLSTSSEQHGWQIPILIAFCWIVSNKKAASILSELGIEKLLHELIVQDQLLEEKIFAGRVLSVFYFQTVRWSTWETSSDLNHSRLCNSMANELRRGVNLSLSRRQIDGHVGTDGEPLFGSDLRDATAVLATYSDWARSLHDQHHTDAAEGGQEPWKGSKWRDYEALEKLVTQMDLLVVYSSVDQLVTAPSVQDNVSTIVRSLCRFIRDRSHVPEHQVLLYLSALGNITSAVGSGILHFELASLVDVKFFERVLLYSRRSSPILSYIASRALWALAVAFHERDVVFQCLRSQLSIVDEDASTKTQKTARNGIDLLVDNVTAKLVAGKAVEGDAGALGCLLHVDTKSSLLFLERYRFSTITKWIKDMKMTVAPSSPTRAMHRRNSHKKRTDLKHPEQAMLSYDMASSARERDLIQLCKVAHGCLVAIARPPIKHSKGGKTNITMPESNLQFNLDDEIIHSKASIVPLLDNHHPLVILEAVDCILVHLVHQPLRIHEFLDAKNVDRLMWLGLAHDHAPLQASCLKATRLVMGDLVCQKQPYSLQDKLFKKNSSLVQCLGSESFDVMKQAIELMAHLLSKDDDTRRRNELAALFWDVEHLDALSHAFATLCGEHRDHPDATAVLQRLVGLVIKLELTKLINSELLIDAMTMAIDSHGGHGFLRPLVCNCMCEIAIQGEKSSYFAKKSRLRVILALLQESLTNGEIRHIGLTLGALAREHSGIRQYLTTVGSGCMAGIARVLGSFSRISVESSSPSRGDRIADYDASEEDPFDSDDIRVEKPHTDTASEMDERQGIRISIDSQVVVSLYDDDVYEEFLRLLTTLLAPFELVEERYGCVCGQRGTGCQACDPCDLFARAHGPSLVARFLFARRVVVRMDDTNKKLMKAISTEAHTIVHLALRVLQTLSASRRCRDDVLHGLYTRAGWWSMSWLMERSKPSDVQSGGVVAEVAISALSTLLHFCADEKVINFVMTKREFILTLFGHLTILSEDDRTLRSQRASMFMLARMAQHSKVVRDLLFQEKMAPLLVRMVNFRDSILRANFLILTRNLGMRLPDENLLNVVIGAVQEYETRQHTNMSIVLIACEVLAHLLMVRPRPRVSTSWQLPPALNRGSLPSSTFLAASSHLPSWRTFVASFRTDEDTNEARLLVDEAEHASSRIWPSSKRGDEFVVLLDFLIAHHLFEDKLTPSAARLFEFTAVSDEIPAVGCDFESRAAESYTPLLQYVHSTVELNAPENRDNSFAGSAQLWRLVRRLWRLCEYRRLRLPNQLRQQVPLHRIIATFARWSASNGSEIVSEASLVRRQQLLSFVNELLLRNSEVCQHLKMCDVIPMLEVFACRWGSVGDGYALLYAMCKSDDGNTQWLLGHLMESEQAHANVSFVSTTRQDLSSLATSPSIHLLWSNAHPTYSVRSLPTSRVHQKPNPTEFALHVLEPVSTSATSPVLAFALALLNKMANVSLNVLVGYLQCHSIRVLLDNVLLTLEMGDSKKTGQPLQVTSLLQLLTKCLRLEPNMARYFVVDPRMLIAVKRQAFATKLPVQMAAIELLHELTQQNPTIVDALRRLDDPQQPPSQIHPWMIAAMDDHITRLQLLNIRGEKPVELKPLSQKQVVLLAHLVHVALFACVKLVDMARLAIAFEETRLVEKDAFMVLGGQTYSTSPTWMSSCSHRQQDEEGVFKIVDDRKALGLPVLLYVVHKKRFYDGSGDQVRQAIAREVMVQSISDEALDPHLLIRRLCRFLVEDHAEMFRRVAFVKGKVFAGEAAKLPRRWNDTLRLLAASPVLEGVSRDSLACLACALREPEVRSLSDLHKVYAHGSYLALVHSERVDYDLRSSRDQEMGNLSSVGSLEPSYVSGRLKRGDLFGFLWLGGNTLLDVETQTQPLQVCVSVLHDYILRSELQPSEYELIRDRCLRVSKRVSTAQDLTKWLDSLSIGFRANTLSVPQQLQHRSLQLMGQLVHQSSVYAQSLLASSGALTTVLQVARSHLDPAIATAAMRVVLTLVEKSNSHDVLLALGSVTLDGDHDATLHCQLRLPVCILQGALALQTNLHGPLHFLRVAVGVVTANGTDCCTTDLLAVVEAAFRSTGREQSNYVDDLVLIVDLLAKISPGTFLSYCRIYPLHRHVVQVLTTFAPTTISSAFRVLFRLVVIFDQDLLCREELHHDLIQAAQMPGILNVVEADLLIVARGVHTSALGGCLEFLQVISTRLIVHFQCESALPLTHHEEYNTAFTRITRVILLAFDRFEAPQSSLLGTVARMCEVSSECARLASCSRVIIQKRSIPFHHYVYSVLRDHLSSHSSAIKRISGEALVHVTRCIRVLSTGPARVTRHFVRHGLIDVAFDCLCSRSQGATVDIQAVVWKELLQAMKTVAALGDNILPKSLLRTHGNRLQTFHTRVVVTRMNGAGIADLDAVTAYIELMVELVKNAVKSKDFLDDCVWLVSDVGSACFEWIHQGCEIIPLDGLSVKRQLPLASLQFVSSICSSPALTRRLCARNDFPNQLRQLCGDLAVVTSHRQSLVSLGYMRYLCLLVEHLAIDPALTACSEEVPAILIRLLLPTIQAAFHRRVVEMTDSASSSSNGTEASFIEVSLRLEWLLFFLARAHPTQSISAIDDVASSVLLTLSRWLHHITSSRAVLNMLGLLSAITRLLVDHGEKKPQLCGAIVDVVFQLIFTRGEQIAAGRTSSQPSEWKDLDWRAFSYEQWHQDDSVGLRIGLPLLLIVVLRRIVCDEAMMTAWMGRDDKNLQCLTTVGLPIALGFLSMRALPTTFVYSAYKKCLVLLRRVISAASRREREYREVATQWRRAMRKSDIVGIVNWLLGDAPCPEQIKLEALKLMTAIVRGSVVDAAEICRHHHKTGVNLFHEVVTLATREHRNHGARRAVVISLELISAAAANSSQTALLAASSIGKIGAFAQAIIDSGPVPSLDGRRVLGALFRSCRVLGQHVLLEEAASLWRLVVNTLDCEFVNDDEAEIEFAVEGIRLLMLVLGTVDRSLQTFQIADLPGVPFWRRVAKTLDATLSEHALRDVFGLCGMLLKTQAMRQLVASDPKLGEVIVMTLTKCMTIDTKLSATLCGEWLQQRSSSQRKLLRSLCGQVGNIATLGTSHQLGLVRLLPAISATLTRLQRTEWISEHSWCSVRDLALWWGNATGENGDELRLAALVAIRCLLTAKQFRGLHDAAAAFRALHARWSQRYMDAMSTSVIAPTSTTTGPFSSLGEETVLGIQVLSGMSTALGFKFDHFAASACSIRCWLARGVLIEPEQNTRDCQALMLVMSQSIDAAGQANPELVRMIHAADGSAARLLSRIVTSARPPQDVPSGDVQRSQRLVLALLHTHASSASTRDSMQALDVDLIDRVSWEMHRVDTVDEPHWGNVLPSRCDIIHLLCVDVDVAVRVRERHLVDQWLLSLAYDRQPNQSSKAKDALNKSFLALAAAVVRHHAQGEERGEQQHRGFASWKLLVVHIVNVMINDAASHARVNSTALELLAHLIRLDRQLLTELWRVCLLNTSNVAATNAGNAQAIILRVLTDPLGSEISDEDRRHAAFVAYSLSTSSRRATPLIRARSLAQTNGHDVVSFGELVTDALYMSVGTHTRRTMRPFPLDWSSPLSLFPLFLNITASDTAVWSLRLLHKCLRDKVFMRWLSSEFDLFGQVLAALACSSLDVSYTAGCVLRDAVIVQQSQRHIVDHDLPVRRFRELAFFADLRAHDDIFVLAPSTSAARSLPSCFAVLELWIHFHSHHQDQLQASVNARAHLEVIQEVALYMVSQCFAQIFTSQDDEDDGDMTASRQCHHRSARNRHTALCSALLQLIGGVGSSPETRRIRLLALELLTAMCAFATTQFSVDVFLDATNIDKVLILIESSESSGDERIAGLHLLRELTQVGAIKKLFSEPSSVLLQRVVSWLDQSQDHVLHSSATTILRRVVAKVAAASGIDNDSSMRRIAQEHHQAMLSAVARALFVRQEAAGNTSVATLDSSLHTAEVCVQRSITSDGDEATAGVILHFRVQNRSRVCLREFRYRGKLTVGRPMLRHEIVLEPEAAWVSCDVVLNASHESTVPTVKTLMLNLAATEDATVSFGGNPATRVTCTHHFTEMDSYDRGVLGRLLLDPCVSQQVVEDALAIVTELSKNHALFCDTQVDLGSQILAVMETTQRLDMSLDLTPLNALTAWFWSHKNNLTHFRTSVAPLLRLVQRVRTTTFFGAPLPLHGSAASEAMFTGGPTFLTSLMEWLATLESESLTENCINVLFFENSDVLMSLAAHFYPHRSPHTSYFFLVATVVRVNRLHCEVFARKHAVQLLLTLLEEKEPQAELLQHAARVVAKITRVRTAVDKFLRHNGMTLFGRIAHAVFRGSENEVKRLDATLGKVADNLVIASSFLCEDATNCVQLPDSTPLHRETLRLLSSCSSENSISLVETLVLFLADQDGSPTGTSSSYERLAAVVLRALIEKWPSRIEFEAALLSGMAHTADDHTKASMEKFTTGLRKCIELTRWDFYSELHVVRRTYSTVVSAGARTGVIPLVLCTAFLPFNSDLFDEQLLTTPSTTSRSPTSRVNSRSLAIPPTSRAVDSDQTLIQELRLLIPFLDDHQLLVDTLSDNRKKTVTSRIKTADSSARVAVGVHAVLVVVFDTFVDALAGYTPTAPFSTRMTPLEATVIVQRWLVVVEQLFGLLCCAFDELDPTYYEEVFQQLQVLVVSELPAFLLKMERIQTRKETVSMVLNNVERLLKRLTNKHELRGVTTSGTSVAQDAKVYLLEYDKMKGQVSDAFTMALSSRDGIDKLHRGIVAAEYMWSRVFGASGKSLATLMAGTKESESLWVKLANYADAIATFLRHPGPVFVERWRKLQKLMVSLLHLMDDSDKMNQTGKKSGSEAGKRNGASDMEDIDDACENDVGDANTGNENDQGTNKAEEEEEEKQTQADDTWLANQLGLPSHSGGLLVSTMPFASLESLLDHFGFASMGVKKQIALLNFAELRPRVLGAIAKALDIKDVATVEAMSAVQLERSLHQFHGQALSVSQDAGADPHHFLQRLRELMAELREIVDDAELGLHLRVVVRRPLELSMWQLLMAPVLRTRLHSAYYAVQAFAESNVLERREMIKEYENHARVEAAARRRKTSTFVAFSPAGSAGSDVGNATTPSSRSTPVVSASGTNVVRSSVRDLLSRTMGSKTQQPLQRYKNRRVALANDALLATVESGRELLTPRIMAIVDSVRAADPLSDEKDIESLKYMVRKRQQRYHRLGSFLTAWLPSSLSSRRYALPSAATSLYRRVSRRIALFFLLLAFWRQEGLESDLNNKVYARAFTSPQEREEYFLAYHLEKAFSELIRVWMPESGTLGLPLWHWQSYGVGGSLLCVLVACLSPFVAMSDASLKNNLMTSATCAFILVVFALSAWSMYDITKRDFVLQERNRLRLQPVGKFYQNILALFTIVIEVVQLNSITFDPTFDYNETDQIPQLIQWLGSLGITQIGIDQVELKAVLCGIALVVWFLMLKCANKFQDSNPFLNRLFTKDLPSLLHGMLYMGFISTFFSFLACIDCTSSYAHNFDKCPKNTTAIGTSTTVLPEPFLMSHQNVPCWTAAHVPYALLGFWGVTFFLPIGLLAHGMNQVLFQQESLDLKYAPVVMLISQFIKAIAATTRAFFTFNVELLASLALVGDLWLFCLMIRSRPDAKRVSLWYIQFIKSGIYAASGWSAAVAIYRIETKASSSVANNLVYMGWVAIGAITAIAARLRMWRRDEQTMEEDHTYTSSQRDLIAIGTKPKGASSSLTPSERQFVQASLALVNNPQKPPSRQVETLLKRAARLAEEDEPKQLRAFMAKARAYANGHQVSMSLTEAVVMQNARKLARKMDDSHDELATSPLRGPVGLDQLSHGANHEKKKQL